MTPQRFDELRSRAELEPTGGRTDWQTSRGVLVECLDEIARLAALVYVPGGWHCPTCKFQLVSSVLYARTGNIGVNHQAPEPCPNDGTPLEPDTWQADAMAMSEHMLKVACMDGINRLRADEGDSIDILCDNPDGPPNCAVEACGEWTKWEPRRFVGETLIQAVAAAVRAKADFHHFPTGHL